MATLIVTYPIGDASTFDAAYYRATHIPLVEQHWRPHGLIGSEILDAAQGQPWAGAVLLRFQDQAAVDASMASAGTAAVMGDIANFTNIAPVIYRAAD